MKFIYSATILAVTCNLNVAFAFSPVPKSFGQTQSTSSFISNSKFHKNSILPIRTNNHHGLNVHPIIGTDEVIQIQNSFHHILESTSTFLSAADVAADATEKSGWWDNYLKFYAGCLVNVHAAIDPPLRSIGWDQTWGVSIFAFTALVRTLLLPLSIEQTKSTEYMKALKPYQNELKEKFKNNKDMLNRATAKLFEDANANPLAGCLISILQLPILIGLYRSITLLAKEEQLQEPFLWIPSLEGPVSPPDFRGLDWLVQNWTDGHPSMGWETTLLYLIMPVVLVLGQSATMRVLSPPPDENASKEEREQMEQTQGALKFLPLLIGFFSLQVPAALTIYWFTSNLYTLLQSVTIRGYYKMNPPKIELPDYWDALDNTENMSADEKRKAAAAGLSVGPTWEEILDEATYHYVVNREPLRENSPAWKRAKSEKAEIPAEMAAWVANSSATKSVETIKA